MSVETPEETYLCPRCAGEYAGGDACPACGALRVPVPCEGDATRQAHSRCVICEKALCDGDAAAIPALCAEHCDVVVIEGFSQVYTDSDELGARLVVENLRAEGIEAHLYSQTSQSFPMDMGELSIARVLVPVWDHQQARELIQSYMDTEGEVVFACPACGEVYEPGAESCASCGAPLGEAAEQS